jgi:NAD(P)-dependent dehydrogenase (short-subunit alcohol dehydrogenase family)
LLENKKEKPMKKLEGKVAVITGGSSGIGLATAKRFALEGASVLITGRRQGELDLAVSSIGKNNVRAVQSDVSNPKELDGLYSILKSEYGDHIDILFANAGVSESAPLSKITEEHFDKIFGINVKGVLFTVQKALPLFHDGGSIILNASLGASKGYPGFTVYDASKAAIRSFVRTWAAELKHCKIRVNAISPGMIDTPILNGLAQTPEQIEQLKTSFASSAPLGRIGSPDEVAKAVSFLASDDSSYITGIELFIDGGIGQI